MSRVLWVAMLLMAAFPAPSLASPAETAVVIFIRGGREVRLDPVLSQAVVIDVLALFGSTTFDSSTVASAQSWAGYAKGSFMIVKFAEPTRITVLRSRSLFVSDLLVSLSRESEPSHLLARHAGRYWSFAKYDPRVLARLVCRPELRLRVYTGFCRTIRP